MALFEAPDLSSHGGSHQVLHEWDFLHTEAGEMYLVLAILGIEYAINIGEPCIDGYTSWLREHHGRSPLYL